MNLNTPLKKQLQAKKLQAMAESMQVLLYLPSGLIKYVASRGRDVKSLIKLLLKTQPLECHLMPLLTVIVSIIFLHATHVSVLVSDMP